jgi:tetratricopeptide (TPR) repeat protein
MSKTLIYFALLLIAPWVSAQRKDRDLAAANKAYNTEQYSSAEAKYRVSFSKAPDYSVPALNLGNAIYRQKQSSEAGSAYRKALRTAQTREEKHRGFHNLGNVLMQEKKYTEAVEAYRNALRNNPADEETRYNFALAKKYLKDNPPPKDDNKDKKDKQDQKDKQDKDKKDQKQDQNQPKDQENQKDPKDQKQDQGQPKPQPAGISKDRMENLLEAVNNEEKKVQDKMSKKKTEGKPSKNEKDW